MNGPASGMQFERTVLAWQRTGLSVAVAATVLARLTFDELGAWAVLTLAVCLGLCGWVMLDSRARYRGRTGEWPRRPPVGRWAAAVTVGIVLLGLAELAALLV